MGRVAVYFNGATYWLAKEGIINTRDKGATWHQNRSASGRRLETAVRKKDARHMIVADLPKDFSKLADGGKTWQRVAPLPPFAGGLVPKLPGQFLSIAWDPDANLLYASRMGSATYRLRLNASIGMGR